MKNALSVLVVTAIVVMSAFVYAQDKVVVIPLGKNDPNLLSENIKAGVTILGVTGDVNVVDTSSGTASSDTILKGDTAYVGGQEITGTMGLFWGCRPVSYSTNKEWDFFACLVDCNSVPSDANCDTLCNAIDGELFTSMEYDLPCNGSFGVSN